LSVVCCLLSVVCCLLSVVCCLLSAVCCLLSVVCWSLISAQTHQVCIEHSRDSRERSVVPTPCRACALSCLRLVVPAPCRACALSCLRLAVSAIQSILTRDTLCGFQWLQPWSRLVHLETRLMKTVKVVTTSALRRRTTFIRYAGRLDATAAVFLCTCTRHVVRCLGRHASCCRCSSLLAATAPIKPLRDNWQHSCLLWHHNWCVS
jgi:hypothetical protein